MALSDNLVVYYSLDEASGNAIDAHSTKDLTDNNTVGAGTGKVNGGRDFALASSEHFTHADDAVFNPSGDFTYAFWCKADTLTFGTSYVLISKDSASPAGNYYIWHNGSINRFNFQVFGSESYGNLGSVEANNLGQPSAGNWYFIVVRHNATADTISIQVNNGTVDSISHSAGVWDNSSTFYLGGDVYGRYWDGLIDEVGLWHRVLTTDEGTELYNSGAGRDYAYITGGATFTATAAVTVSAATASGSATHTAPTYTATAAVSVSAATAAGVAAFTPPTFRGYGGSQRIGSDGCWLRDIRSTGLYSDGGCIDDCGNGGGFGDVFQRTPSNCGGYGQRCYGQRFGHVYGTDLYRIGSRYDNGSDGQRRSVIQQLCGSGCGDSQCRDSQRRSDVYSGSDSRHADRYPARVANRATTCAIPTSRDQEATVYAGSNHAATEPDVAWQTS